MPAMVKNVFFSGRLHVLFAPGGEDFEDDYNLVEFLQAQDKHIELLEEQNNALLRQERMLLQVLELSSQTSRAITESLIELKNILSEDQDTLKLQELARHFEGKNTPESSN